MKLTVLNEDKFLSSIAYGSNASYYGNEYEVLAVFTYGTIKKKTQYLILLDNILLTWCPKSKAIKITSDGNENWVFIPKFVRDYKKQWMSVVFKNLYCPKWMIDEEDFFYDIFENNEEAVWLLKQKITEKV